MPDFTPNFDLPYPSPTDRPCDFATQWCEFTGAVNSVLDVFTAGADRAEPVIPAALARMSVGRNVINLNPIPFDEIVMDTAGMTDLDADPYTITVQQTGRYTVAGFVEKASSGVVDSQLGLFIDPTSIVWVIIDRGVGPSYWLPAYTPSYPLNAGETVQLRYNSGTATSQMVFTAWLAVIWHADTEVP